MTRRANGRLSKRWTQRAHIDGKYTTPRSRCLARGHAGRSPTAGDQEPVRLSKKGRNPRGKNAPTFREAAEHCDRASDPHLAQRRQISQAMETVPRTLCHIPVIGDKSVARIDTADLLKVLAPHWNQRSETMRRVKQRIGAVLGWAVAAGHRTDQPCQRAGNRVGSAQDRTGRHASELCPIPRLPDALRDCRGSQVLTVQRVLATWFSHIDGNSKSGEARHVRLAGDRPRRPNMDGSR